MKELEYPFDPGFILKKRRSLRKELLSDGTSRIKKKIAVLAGSTVDDIVLSLELFLLNFGIECEFYVSEYNMFWEDGVFGNDELEAFAPDLVYVCTSVKNLSFKSDPRLTRLEADEAFQTEKSKFTTLWDKLKRFNCPILQNNFEQPFYALMGSMDCFDYRGLGFFVSRMNMALCEYAQQNCGFYVVDLARTAAEYGLDSWHDRANMYMYKIMCARLATPYVAYKAALVIKSLYGKNRKLLALDLDNTLWGGVVGDDGVEGIAIGQENASAEGFYDFQEYVKSLKNLGVALSVCSKNEEENALAGLNHPEGVLKPNDFAVIKANWEPKDKNLLETVAQMGLTAQAIVFADDNPAERERVSQSVSQAAVPEISAPENYIREISKCGFFETTSISADDLNRAEMYRQNAKRAELAAEITDYGEYLDSLEMTAEITHFKPVYYQRITQLTNKSNQFNLTTRRFNENEIKSFAEDGGYIPIYGKLSDKFGDNGVVSVVIGKVCGEELEIILWLMSCRVLKRDMELAMLDTLVRSAKSHGIKRILGEYIPTAKNKMVKNFYDGVLGFEKLSEDEEGLAKFKLDIENYENKNKHIKITEEIS